MKSIRTKLLIYFLTPIIVLALGYTAISEFIVKNSIRNYTQEILLNYTKDLAEELKDNILIKNTAKLTETAFYGEKQGFHVSYVIVLDQNNQILAHTLLGESPTQEMIKQNAIPENKENSIVNFKYKNNETLEISQSIVMGLYRIGIVKIGYDLTEINQFLAYSDLMSIVFIIIILILVLIIIIILSQLITKPITNLTKSVEKFSHGDGIYKMPMIKNKNDEIGRLAQIFDTTTKNLANSQKNLIAEKEKLEKRINELESWGNVTTNRELKMIELKNRIKELEDKLK